MARILWRDWANLDAYNRELAQFEQVRAGLTGGRSLAEGPADET